MKFRIYAKGFFYIITIIICILFGINAGCTDRNPQPVDSPNPAGNNMASPSPAPDDHELERLYQRGKDAQRSADFEEAVSIYQKILKRDPDHYRARGRLGEIYYLTGEYEMAIREFKKVREANPPNPGASASNLVLCYLAVDRPESALEYITPEIDRYSRWDSHYSFLAQAHYARYMLADSPEEMKKILGRLKDALKQGMSNADNPLAASMMEAGLQLFQNDYKEAERALEKAWKFSESNKDRISILFLLGSLASRRGDNRKALEYFNRVLETCNKTPRLEFQSFMDGFYSLWAKQALDSYEMKYGDIKAIVDRIPGGIREPEMKEFIGHFRDYLSAKKEKKYQTALESLKKIENSLKDESIEGDYFYDGIYKPYILNLLYNETADLNRAAGNENSARQYEDKAKEIYHSPFPQP